MADQRGTDADRTRCGEQTRAGHPCRNWAVADGRCRVHARKAAAPDSAAEAESGSRGRDGTNGARHGTAAPRLAKWSSDPAASRSGFRSADFQPVTHRRGQRGATGTGDGDETSAGSPSGAAGGANATPGGSQSAADADAGGLGRAAGGRDVGGGARPGRPTGGRGDSGDLIDALGAALGGDLGAHLATVGDFLRRRFTGDYDVDEFGLDEDLVRHVLLPLLRPLYDTWWRVSSSDRDNIPDGGALLVANHAGTLPFDGMILNYDVHDATGRFVRELGANLVFRTPFVGHLGRKSGAVRASHADADAVLARGELAGVFPEGFKGLGKPFSQRYQLERFGRGGFVATALRARVPIVPVAIVGSEEIYPILWDARVIAKALGLPYFPIVAQMLTLPVLGPAGLLPLPSKWSVTYGEPIPTAHLGPGAADDPMIVFEMADRIRDTIQTMLTRVVMGRKSVFF
ncbi:MAG TPA: lysophospholipid acyltransferase family protein [Nitriliruptoraceae bacterium]|nr:lysophospholipid acyltransferase family protein [Nitriliruptoraceae bacterium]